VPVGEHDQAGAGLDGGVGLGADLGEPRGERGAAAGDPVQARQGSLNAISSTFIGS
jgi:hypothetical protein